MDLCLFARPDLAPGGDVDAFLALARHADAAGLHSLCFGEHLVMAPDTSRYPYGPWGHPPDTAWPDPLLTLAAVAAVTERIRLSTAVLLAPLRAGLVLAKEVATLDVLSHGRVELGVGTGWQSEEYAGVGLAWAERRRRFDEVIETCRLAWGDQPFSLPLDAARAGADGLGAGRLEGLTARPVPVQRRIPLFYGVAATAANVRRIARLGDGWTPVGVTPEQVRAGVAALRSAYADAGRDPATLVVRVPLPPVPDAGGGVDAARTVAAAGPYLEAGATMVVAGHNHRLRSAAEAGELVEGLAAAAKAL
ncbi:TIGR03619 family F420-dependent LLM class oxidoreductase [Frankia sp. QA3]|uniref:TIGR03619 family F420-dependent LLM class oxidoreductase n=1 Tax=Frankia sp. QA3 TaxID=710111 RepID=UPI000269BF9E|nr:TIGR03619 family F420-dependent LLM class oxidoreductase [Frankia sp. QA3]EIV91519.1 putative F420-dependent oxidoreductase, Rv2161c family [Frankia sp. QA3]